MKLTPEEIRKIIIDCLGKLESLGPEFKLEDDLTINFNLFDATTTFGQCGLGVRDNQFKQEISFNKHLMVDSLKDIIINTVYHECCHYYQNKEAIATGYYSLENGQVKIKDDKALEEYFIGNDAGHSACWMKYVNIVNERLKPVIPVSAHPVISEFDLYLDANKEDIMFKIYCEKCDNEIKFLSYTRKDWNSLPLGMITTLIKMQDENVPNNFCKCGGCLKVWAKDEQTMYNILKSENECFFETMIRGGLFGGKNNGKGN